MDKKMVSVYRIICLMICVFCVSCATTNNVEQIAEAENLYNITTEYIELTTISGFKQRVILLTPENPKAILILFPGWKCLLYLGEEDGLPVINKSQDSFIVRSRYEYAKQGLIVVLPDSPEEYKPVGLGKATRSSKVHRECIREIINFCQERHDLPLWLYGWGAGTFSVSNLGVSLRDEVDGLIYANAILYSKTTPAAKYMHGLENGVIDLGLFMINDPVLILHHRYTPCNYGPPGKTKLLKSKLTNSPGVEIKLYTGGSTRDWNCGEDTRQGYEGLDHVIVKDVADFVIKWSS